MHSWIFSFALHGLMVGAAVAFLSEIEPRPKSEPFTWKVAFIDAPIQPSPERAAPPASKPSQAPTPARNLPPPTQSAAQPSEQAVATPAPHRVSVRTPEPPSTDRQPSEPQRPAKADLVPVNQAVHYAARQEPVREEQPETSESRQPIHAAQATDPSTTPAEHVRHAPPTEPQPASATPTHSERTEPAQASPTPAFQSPSRQPALLATTGSAPVPAVASEPSASAAPALVTAKASGASGRAGTGKGDHRWLAEALWHRIQRLKQYPKLARNQGWEGRVVVRVLIKDDGSLMDANIVESSGFEILDLDAVDLIRQVCPLALKQALGQTHVAIHIPIQYRLDQ